MSNRALQSLLLATLLAAACDLPPGDPAVAGARAALTQTNGIRMNGIRMNGEEMNGIRMNGIRMNDADLAGIRLAGGRLVAVRTDGSDAEAEALVGTLMSGALAGGGSVDLRIDAVTAAPAPNQDLYGYMVSYATAGGWQPLCGSDGAGQPIAALPLAGVWDYREGVAGGGSWSPSTEQFTFACRGAAIAKCVEAGYRPWVSGLGGMHQACTRMIRADYCGDGRSFTVDGRAINIYDYLGIQQDSESWTFEAEWHEGGARCLTQQRVLRLSVELDGALLSTGIPSCILSRVALDCGARSHLGAATPLMNEFYDRYLGLGLNLGL